MRPPKIFQELPPHEEAMARGEWDRAFSILSGAAAQRGAGPLPLEEALALAQLLQFRGEGARAVTVLEEISRASDPRAASRALLGLAALKLSGRSVPLEEVEGLIDRAAGLAGGEKVLLGIAAHTRSRVLWRKSRHAEAGEFLEEARRLLEEAGEEEELAKVLDSLAMHHEQRGEREKALSAYALSLSKKAQWRDLYGIGITLGNLGRFHLRMGEARTALSCFLDDLRIAERIGDLGASVVLRINVGQALTALDRLEEAEKELGEALLLARSRGWVHQEVYAMKDLARAVARRGDSARALALLSAALGLLPPESPPYMRGQVLLVRGEVLLELGDLQEARAAFTEARRGFSSVGALHEEASAVKGLAEVSRGLGERNPYLQLLEEGKELTSTLPPLTFRFEDTQVSGVDRLIPRGIGPYRILSRLGAGAYGEVYRGFDGREGASRDDVAIKVLRLEGVRDEKERQERLRRFERECEILRRLSHPHVVRLIESGEDGLPYLVQEFVGGGDLSRLIAGGQGLPPGKAVEVMRGILAGLAALHEKGVLHRDLKPANVLLREDGRPVIADFGIARMVELTALTLQSMIMGTLGYMSPQQLRGEEVDERSDIYAAGVILFQLLSGKLPHGEGTIPELLRSIEGTKAPDLAAMVPGIPPALAACAARCLETDPARRPASAAEMLRELEGFGSGGVR